MTATGMILASAVGLALWAVEQRRRRAPRRAITMTQTRHYLLRATAVPWATIVAVAVICSAVLIAVATGAKR